MHTTTRFSAHSVTTLPHFLRKWWPHYLDKFNSRKAEINQRFYGWNKKRLICERNLQVGEKKKVLRRSNAQKMNCSDLYLTLNHSSQRFWTFFYKFCMLSKEQNTISYYLYNCTIVGKSSYIREGIAKPQSKLLYKLCSTLSYFILVQKCSNSCHNFNITNQGRFRTLYRLIHCAFIYWNYSTYESIYTYLNQGVLMKNLY